MRKNNLFLEDPFNSLWVSNDSLLKTNSTKVSYLTNSKFFF